MDYSIKSIIHGPSLHETIQVLKNCRGLKYALIVLGFEEFVSQSHEKDNGILSRKNGLPIQPFPTLLLVVLEVPFLVQNSLTVLLETNICRLSSHTTKKAALNNSEYAAPCLPVTVFPAQLELQVSHLLKRTICTQLFSVTVLYTEQHWDAVKWLSKCVNWHERKALTTYDSRVHSCHRLFLIFHSSTSVNITQGRSVKLKF